MSARLGSLPAASLLLLLSACGLGCEPAPLESSASTSPSAPEQPEPPGSGEGLPCDIHAALSTACGACHSDPPKYGAPMSLASLADVQAPAASDPSRSVRELMIERLTAESDAMPPGGDIEEGLRQLLVDWLQAGAPAGDDDSCQGSGGAGGSAPVGPDALPCEPTHVFTAHASGESSAFTVPEVGADNLYQCFSFASPFGDTTQATAWAPIVDDERVLHHWILYRTQTPQVDGAVTPCAMPSDSTFVAGWAPGGQNFVLPDEVGLELGGAEHWYILQVHYHNTAHHDDALDASGVAFCTTDTPREHTAGIVSLGTIAIDVPPHAVSHEETGLCPSWITNYLPGPLTMIASFPHMHELGRKLETDILRDGRQEAVDTLVSVDEFSFDDQRYYAHDPPVLLHPGDALRTTCTYDNPGDTPVGFGEKTEDEMCFNFVLVYPIELLGETRNCGLF
jgi:uncharacterized protein YbaA (DUF1428 family)